MSDFIPGQRWINDAQLQMGLGTVLQTDFRTVTVIFLATGETFVYSKESVPLTRVRFSPGDHIVTLEKENFEVIEVTESEGLIIYQARSEDGAESAIDESCLDFLIQLNRPTERLFHGQVDRDLWFEVRYQTQKYLSDLSRDPLRGLAGGRVSLIPHQLYIANEVARRYAPRVLLADEVGLGKTIEAGMILHHQLVSERAKRVLIVVPDSLVHQWLVEMLRRFNLSFSVFDEQRYRAILSADDDEPELNDAEEVDAEPAEEDRSTIDNPFQTEQLVICSVGTLTSDPDIYKHCRAGEWDMLVVDEAHHLQWSQQEPSLEYALVEKLAEETRSVLLLTATPEQLGRESHFARLRLLDPARFSDFDSFVQEEERYKPIADLVHQLEGQDLVSAEHRSSIEKTLSPVALENLDLDNLDKDVLMERLLDEHGTGRVLFRNTRTAVKGFPEREVHAYPMAMPDAYRDVLAMLQGQALSEMQLLLSPELLYQVVSENSGRDWVKLDPRVAKLVEMTKAIRPQKMLVITASADTALDLTEHLRVTEGIQAAVFHEGMSLIERDRAAAWFADQISGAPLLICSEIGSEGRNFQFAHHLFLFDLPLNPDLLEQRIGRLDRIGQRNTVQIHVPYLENSAQSIMFRWYEDGLNAFAQTCPTGHQVFNQEHERLERVLHDVVESPGKVAEAVDSLVEDTHRLNRHLIDAMSTGRDRLLEFNSCRPEKAETLRKRALEMDNASTLQPYLEGVFDCIGVDYEVHSEDCFAVSASPNMMAVLPQLPEDGMTITYDRETALTFEDVDYLTWDHPLVVACMDWILSGEQGNTAVLALPVAGAQRGHLLLESIFILETASTAVSNSARYLPPTTLRVFIDQTGKRYEHLDSIQTRDQKIDRVRPDVAKKVIAAKTGLINKMIRASRKLAEGQVVSIKNNAFVDVRASLEAEISRLDYLLKINPNVRQEEIDFFNASLDGLNEQIDNASLRLDALRVIVAT